MVKHKANFLVDKEDWIVFQNWAAIQGSNATEKLCEYIATIAKNELPEDYKQQIDEQVHQKLNDFIDDLAINAIALRVSEVLGLRVNNLDTVDTPDTPNSSITVDISDTVDTPDTPLDANLSNTPDTPLTYTEINPVVRLEPKIAASDTVETEASKAFSSSVTAITSNDLDQEINLEAVEKQSNSSDSEKQNRNQRLYTSVEVAEIEGYRNPSRVSRYRTGKRRPKDRTFFNRWDYCEWDNKFWVKK